MIRAAKFISTLLSASLAAATFAGMAQVAQAQQSHVAERASFPVIRLAGRQHSGRAAVDQLGARLGDVAAWYGKSAAELRRELLADRRMRVDQQGRLLAVEEMEAPVAAVTASAAQAAVQTGSLVGLDQTFRLHSKPGAARTIYLDFNGARIANTVWNSNGMVINAQPYDIDGNPAAFSTTELQRIQLIWQRVAEDYAAFDADITTEQPTQDRLTRSSSTDLVYGTTVVVTKTAGVYSCTCGGIAYVGVFNYTGGSQAPDYYKPAFVFYDMLGNGDEKAVAEAISHETGHNIGLHHDGTAEDAYYSGQGTGSATAWAPIMGVGYYKPLVQFSRGEYTGASNTEDDFAVAASFGLPLRRDDYGNTIAAARRLFPSISAGKASVRAAGIIGAGGDRDVFAVTAGEGAFSASATPASRSANADLVLTLRDASGRVLASANPIDALNASLSVNIPVQGTYYLEVRGAGQGTAATTGYSSYGSVGNFLLAAGYVAPAGTPPTPVLSASISSGVAPLAVTLSGAQSKDDGRVAFWYWNFGDGSGDNTGSLATVSHVYRSAGTYIARLTVVDNQGLSASTTRTIVVASATASIK